MFVLMLLICFSFVDERGSGRPVGKVGIKLSTSVRLYGCQSVHFWSYQAGLLTSLSNSPAEYPTIGNMDIIIKKWPDGQIQNDASLYDELWWMEKLHVPAAICLFSCPFQKIACAL